MIFRPGSNCWKAVPIKRVSVLIDCDCYYRQLYQALLKAEQAVFILGWDIDSRVSLMPGEEGKHDVPVRLGDLLHFITKDKPDLNIYILIWDFYYLFAWEREFFSQVKFHRTFNHQLHFELDDQHPVGGSQHQKLVVIDDQVAFCGGIDITGNRWDTSEHALHEDRRVSPMGHRYGPHHDVQVMLEGEAAHWMGKICRHRWYRATGKEIPQREWKENKDGFDQLYWDYGKTILGISRTLPAYKDFSQVQEVLQMYLDLIKKAQKKIYIENQYLTSRKIGEALAKRLQERNGPEITILIPRDSAGFLEFHTMVVLRDGLIEFLKSHDQYHRLKIYYPALSKKTAIKIHSKVMIIDDQYFHIGSANLSNRSMGLDAECDVTFDASQDEGLSEYIQDLQARLISEYLSFSAQDVQQKIKHQSLQKIIQEDSKKRLYEIEVDENEFKPYKSLTENDLVDLETPLSFDVMFDTLFIALGKKEYSLLKTKTIIFGTFIGLLLLLTVLWMVTPLHDLPWYEQFERLFQRPDQPFLEASIILSFYVVAAFLFIPVNLLILFTATSFPTLEAFVYVLLGALLNAIISYGMGRGMGKKLVRQYFVKKSQYLADKLRKGGVIPLAIIRLIPIAPYSIVNLIAGAFCIPFWTFLLGTALGILPGAFFLIFFQKSLLQVLQDPSPLNFFFFFVWLSLLIGMWTFFRRRLKK